VHGIYGEQAINYRMCAYSLHTEKELPVYQKRGLLDAEELTYFVIVAFPLLYIF